MVGRMAVLVNVGSQDHATRLRLMAWASLALLTVWAVATSLMDLDPVQRVILADVPTYLMPHAVAVVLLAVLTLDTLGTVLEHRFWGLLLLAVIPVLVAESYWSLYVIVVDSRGPLGSVSVRVLHSVAQVLMFILLFRMTRFGALPLLNRVRFHIDVLSALAVLWPVLYLGWTLQLIGPLDSGGSMVAGVSAIYPLFGLMAVVVTSTVVFASRGARAPWERIVALSLMVYGFNLILNPLLNALALRGDERGFAWLTTLGGFAAALLCVGVTYRLTPGAESVIMRDWELPTAIEPRALRYFPVVVAGSLVPLGILSLSRAGTPSGVPLQYATVFVAVLMALRSLIAAVERARTRAMAILDPETGAFDRRLLADRLDELVDDASESGRPLSVVVFDISDFVRLAAFGPARRRTGRDLVEVIRSQSRSPADVFKIGEDRYAVLLDGEAPGDAASFALRVWLAAGSDRAPELPDISMGIGAGIASFPMHALTPDGLLAAAELAVAAARAMEGEPVAVYDDSVEMLEPDERYARERMRLLRSTVRALAEAVDARDPATKDHSVNVSELATALAQVLDLSDRQVQIVGLGALMHDVGKIGVRDEILLRPGPLSPEERAEIEEHTLLGERILAPAMLDDILPLVRWHHERWDGSGYPDRLTGEEIPIEARILAVCDAFETLTTGRPYRAALSIAEALEEIEACAGAQFDPAVTAAFARMVRGLAGERVVTASP